MAKKTKRKSTNNRVADAATKRRAWEKADIKYLTDGARKGIATAVMAKQLKRTEGSVRQKAFELELSLRAKRA